MPRYKPIHKVSIEIPGLISCSSFLTLCTQRAGPYVIDWGTELETTTAKHVSSGHPSAAGTKRKPPAPSSADHSAPLPKRTKPESAGPPGGSADDDMRNRFRSGTVGKMTVAVLREWCEARTLETSGKKQELVDRVEEYFERK